MKQKTRILAVIFGLALLAGCGQQGGKAPAQESKQVEASVAESKAPAAESNTEESAATKEAADEPTDFSDWQEVHPKWMSITTFYEKDYLKKAAEEKAKNEKTTAEALLKDHEEGAHTDIASFEFDGNKLTLKDKDEKEILSADYKYVKTIGKGVEHGEFAIFEAVGEVPEQYKAFAIMEPHGGEGDITHFHARYGKSVDDPALTNDKWWPVYVDPASTQEQVIKEILENED